MQRAAGYPAPRQIVTLSGYPGLPAAADMTPSEASTLTRLTPANLSRDLGKY